MDLILKKLHSIREDMLRAAPQITEPCVDIDMSAVYFAPGPGGKPATPVISITGVIDIVENILRIGNAVRRH